jgi:hypothetical protein
LLHIFIFLFVIVFTFWSSTRHPDGCCLNQNLSSWTDCKVIPFNWHTQGKGGKTAKGSVTAFLMLKHWKWTR